VHKGLYLCYGLVIAYLTINTLWWEYKTWDIFSNNIFKCCTYKHQSITIYAI